MSLINSSHSFFLKISRPATIAAITVITLLFSGSSSSKAFPAFLPSPRCRESAFPTCSLPTLPPPSRKSSPASGSMAAAPIVSSWNASISCSPRSTDSSSLWSPPSASLVSSPIAQRCKNSACFPGSPHFLTTRKTSASSRCSESVPWSCPTCRSSPMHSLSTSGLSPQSVSYCCWWQPWDC